MTPRLTAKHVCNSSKSTKGFSTPVLNGIYDYGLADIFSIGIGGSFQQYGTKHINDSWGALTINWQETVQRINIGLRPMFHLTKNTENLDFYTGFRFGYTNYSRTNNFPDPVYYNNNLNNDFGLLFYTNYSVQAILGARYYPAPNFGINMEACIGAPYFVMLGMNYKF